jgi:uncharacterized membrane protein
MSHGAGGDESHERGRASGRPASILPLDRFTAFSDGVFAIAITLLVLEIAVPSLRAPLLPALLALGPDLLGYLISFAYIGGIWMSHAGLTKLMKQGDATAYGLNLLVLIFVALLPFTTRLMVTHISGPDVSVATTVYGLNALFSALMLSFLIFHVARQPDLLVDELAKELLARVYRRRWIINGAGAAAVLLALVAPLAAVALYLGIALLYLVMPLLSMHRGPRSAPQ